MEIDRIEDWIGQTLVDGDGEKIGKLEDVFFAGDSREPALAAVKTGLLGRGRTLVPLAGAKAGRDYLQVTVSKALVKDAPDTEATDEVDPAEAAALSSHYGSEIPADRGLGSAQARGRREAEARAAAQRAEELETVAEQKGTEAQQGESEAEASRARAAKEREDALRQAQEERRKAGER